MPKKTNNIVKQSNAIARAHITPRSNSVWDGRIIATFAAQIRQDDTEFREHTLEAKALSTQKRLDTYQLQEIKKATTRLIQSYFEITQNDGSYVQYAIFTRIGYDVKTNRVYGEFNPRLKEHLLELKEQFTRFELPEYQEISGSYAQDLFVHLYSWKSMPEITIPIEQLHDRLQTPLTYRKNFRHFSLYVLEPAHKEITSKTTLQYDWKPIREGLRKVIAVCFIFNSVKVQQLKQQEEAAAAKRKADKAEEIRCAANNCYLEHYHQRLEDCRPKKRSAVCKYCNGERGLRSLCRENDILKRFPKTQPNINEPH